MLKVIEEGQLQPERITIPTPSLSLNHALGGGLQTSTFNLFHGNEGAGKSTFNLNMAGLAQQMGFRLVYVNLENTYDDPWAKACGVDIAKRKVIPNGAVEDVSEVLVPMMRDEDRLNFIIIDSISAAVPKKFEEDDGSGNGIGLYAKAQKLLNDHIAMALRPNSIVIYIAQQSTGFNQMGGFIKANVAKRIEFASSCTVKLFTSQSKDNIVRDPDTMRITSQQVSWTIEKCKINASLGTKGSFWFNKETAEIQKKLEIIHIAKRIGIIEGTTWLNYGDKKAQGAVKFMELLTDEDYRTMEDTIMSLAAIGSDPIGDE